MGVARDGAGKQSNLAIAAIKHKCNFNGSRSVPWDGYGGKLIVFGPTNRSLYYSGNILTFCNPTSHRHNAYIKSVSVKGKGKFVPVLN
jgi:hypothetical protein